MREPNVSSTLANRPVLCITSGVYDRRALDCTATVPLINSLTHLAYMTSTSPRLRDTLTNDGGLEKLVSLVQDADPPTDYRHFWKWSIAFQCIANTGIRGSERVRTRIVEAGALQAMIPILESYLHFVDSMRRQQSNADSTNSYEGPQRQQADNQQNPTGQERSRSLPLAAWSPRYRQTLRESAVLTNIMLQQRHDDINSYPRLSAPPAHSMPRTRSHSAPPGATPTHVIPAHRYQRRSTFPYIRISPSRRRTMRKARAVTGGPPVDLLSIHGLPSSNTFELYLFYRKEDVALCLQLLAFLSKYTHIRDALHNAYSPSLFALVERFCESAHSSTIKHWAGIVMRNACRRDEARGGLRRCAHWRCHKWEQTQREFAKCKRCRKAKYCSKTCQSIAWSEGHRRWCIERPNTDHNQEQTQAQAQQDRGAPNDSDRPHAPEQDAPPQPSDSILPASPALTGQSMISTDEDRQPTISL